MVRLADLLNDIQDGEVELEMSAVVSELYDEHAKVMYLYAVILYTLEVCYRTLFFAMQMIS